MQRLATIAWAGCTGTVDLERAALVVERPGAARATLTPAAAGVVAWRVLDRTPVSVRLGGFDAAGERVAVCRFEADDAGLFAEIAGARWHDHPDAVRF